MKGDICSFAAGVQKRLLRRWKRLADTEISPPSDEFRKYRTFALENIPKPKKYVSSSYVKDRAVRSSVAIVTDNFFTPYGKDILLEIVDRAAAVSVSSVVVAGFKQEEVDLFLRSLPACPSMEELQCAAGTADRWGEDLPVDAFYKMFSRLAEMGVKVVGGDLDADEFDIKDSHLASVVLLEVLEERGKVFVLCGRLRAPYLASALTEAGMDYFVVDVDPERGYFEKIETTCTRPKAAVCEKKWGAVWTVGPLVHARVFVDWALGERKWVDVRRMDEEVRRAFETISDWLGVNKVSYKFPIVYVCGDERYIKSLFSRRDVDDSYKRMVVRHIESGESWTDISWNRIILGSPSVTHLGEELTHWLRLRIVDEVEYSSKAERAAALCLHEALGFVGAKVLGSTREPPLKDEAVRVLDTMLSPDFRGFSSREIEFHAAHVAGYFLGNTLYTEALSKGSRNKLKQLFTSRFSINTLRKVVSTIF